MKYKVTEIRDLDDQAVSYGLDQAGPEEQTRVERYAGHVEYIDIFDDLETAQAYYKAVTAK